MIPTRRTFGMLAGAVLLGTTALPAQAQQPSCTITFGAIFSQTGGMASIGAAMAQGSEFAIRQVNEAGGVNGCRLAMELRDDQTQPSIGVDAAKQLVEIQRVPVVIGAISSAVSMAVLTSVTAPARVVQIAPASSSPTFTNLAREGRTGGFWFRAIPSDALGAVAAARVARDQTFGRIAVVHINNDFGVNLAREFQAAYTRLGGQVTTVVPYNPGQASYNPEVQRALATNPQSVYIIGTPGDGTTVTRAWISLGGPQKFLFNEGMSSDRFFADVGAQFLGDAWSTRSGSLESPSRAIFQRDFDAAFGEGRSRALAVDRAYDAAAIAALAVASARSTDPAQIRDHVRRVQDPNGTPVTAGVEGFRQALALLRDGRPIRYVGVLGPIAFDEFGDITGPILVMRVRDGRIQETGTTISREDLDALLRQVRG